MASAADALLTTVAQQLHIPEDRLLREGLRAYLERQLRAIQAEILEICGRYGVRDVRELEAQYESGALEEADSWRDAQRLDHLEYQRDRLQELLGVVA